MFKNELTGSANIRKKILIIKSNWKSNVKAFLFLAFVSYYNETKFLSCSLFAVLYQKRLKREKRLRSRYQYRLDTELRRYAQLENAIKSGAPAEALRLITGSLSSSYRRFAIYPCEEG